VVLRAKEIDSSPEAQRVETGFYRCGDEFAGVAGHPSKQRGNRRGKWRRQSLPQLAHWRWEAAKPARPVVRRSFQLAPGVFDIVKR